MSELKSCPFCGAMPYQDPKYLYVKCETVGCASYCYQSPVPPKLWNTRHDSELIATQDALEVAVEALKRLRQPIDTCDFNPRNTSWICKECKAEYKGFIDNIPHYDSCMWATRSKALSNPILKNLTSTTKPPSS